MLNQTQGGRQNGPSEVIQQQIAIPLLQNLGGKTAAPLTAKINSGSLNRITDGANGHNIQVGKKSKSKSKQSIKTQIQF